MRQTSQTGLKGLPATLDHVREKFGGKTRLPSPISRHVPSFFAGVVVLPVYSFASVAALVRGDGISSTTITYSTVVTDIGFWSVRRGF